MILTKEKFKEQLEINIKTAIAGLRDCKSFKVGDVARQGDVYFHKVDKSHPKGKEIKIKQLVPGSNKGSRHMADSAFKVYEGIEYPSYFNDRFKQLKECLGPVVEVTDPTKLFSHPEHCNFSFSKGDMIQVTYQFDLKTRKRVID